MPKTAPLECGVCERRFWVAGALYKHQITSHNFTIDTLCQSGLHAAAAEAEVSKYNMAMQDFEVFATQPGSDELSFRCQYCETEFPKTLACNHFCRVHGEEADDIRAWQVSKDVKRIKQNKPPLARYLYDQFFAPGSNKNALTIIVAIRVDRRLG